MGKRLAVPGFVEIASRFRSNWISPKEDHADDDADGRGNERDSSFAKRKSNWQSAEINIIM